MAERAPSPGGRGIRIEGLTKRYGQGDTAVDALRGVNTRVRQFPPSFDTRFQ